MLHPTLCHLCHFPWPSVGPRSILHFHRKKVHRLCGTMQLHTTLSKLVNTEFKVTILIQGGEKRPSIHCAQLQSLDKGLVFFVTSGLQDKNGQIY